MKQRIDTPSVAPEAFEAMLNLERYLRGCGLEAGLIHLVKLRASQINGCAYCVDMHSKDARAHGEEEQRLHALAVWSETPFFSERERAALSWAEAITRIGEGVPDALYAEARRQFSEKELVDLTVVVATINAWNRLAIPFRPPVGSYRPPATRA